MMMSKWQGHLPLVAILRGVRPSEVIEIADNILQAGFSIIEVPLNSPEPFESIKRLVEHFSSQDFPDVLIGAGTVLEVAQVEQLAEAGGQLVVSPNMDPKVIQATKVHNMVSMPGVATPTEAFTALAAGADILKIFPSDMVAPKALKAMKSVLPKNTKLYPVGGVHLDNMNEYIRHGASGFGFGSALYQLGRSGKETGRLAKQFVAKVVPYLLSES